MHANLTGEIETYHMFVKQLVERIWYVHDWAFVGNVFG